LKQKAADSVLFVQNHNTDPAAHRQATEQQTGFARFATDAEHVAHARKNIGATPWGVWKLLEAVKSDAVDLASSLKFATSQAVQVVNAKLTTHQNDSEAHSAGIHGGCIWFDGAVNSSGRPLDAKTGQPDLNYGVCDGRTYTAPDGRRVKTINAKDRFIVVAGGKYSVGSTGGAERVSLSSQKVPSHKHYNGVAEIDYSKSPFVYGKTTSGLPGKSSGNVATEGNRADCQGYTSTVGGSSSHENRPPYIGLFLIKRL